MSSNQIPQHIAIIMDGNRRWAKLRGLSVDQGHEEGVKNVERIIEAAEKMGIEFVTIYALSTENIKERSKKEVAGLFSIIKKSFQTRLKQMIEEGIRVNIIGEDKGMPGFIKKINGQIQKLQPQKPKMTVNIAINYGGKKELITTVKKIIAKVGIKKLNEENVDKYLYTADQPNPEMVIRTGGNIRLSNFLIWQTAYAELYFAKKYWPQFGEKDLKKAIVWLNKQQRNFGK